MSNHEYIVVSESETAHLVCLRRDDKPEWLQVIATFIMRQRAEDYAGVDNDCRDDPDWPRGELQQEVPELPLPPDNIGRIREWMRAPDAAPLKLAEPKPDAVAAAAALLRAAAKEEEAIELEPPAAEEREEEPVPQVSEPPAPSYADQQLEGQPAAAGTIPELMLRFLPGWMEKFEGGPTIKQVVAQTKLREIDVREAFNVLRDDGRAVVWRADGGAPLQIASLGFEPPQPKELSNNEEKVLGYLATLEADEADAVTPPSTRDMGEKSGVPEGSLGAVVSALEKKQKIEVMARGQGAFQKPRYRVVERTILRQALAQESGVRDVSALVFDDPPFERSALAEHLKRRERVSD